MHADVGARRSVDVTGILFGARLQLQSFGIVVIDVDARDPRRTCDGHVEGRRRDGAGDDAVFEGRRHRIECKAERAGLVGGHLPAPPSAAVGDLHLRNDRRSIPDEARLNGERRSCFDPSVSGRDLERQPVREGGQPDGIDGLSRRAPPHRQDGSKHENRRGGLKTGTAQRFRRNDAMGFDFTRALRRVGEHQLRQGRS